MKISGKISQVFPLQEGVSQQGAHWRKQSIVVVEDDANIAFIRTREYNGKVYNDVNVYKLIH